MTADQAQYVADFGFSGSAGVGEEAGHTVDAFPHTNSARKSPISSYTVGESPNSANESEKSPDNVMEATAAVAKPKRVRTGCLTCRSRHLKCDEGTPVCQNCRKSNRECERGIRLNFIDTTTPKGPLYLVPPTQNWRVTFQDESREIADEYKGGLDKYAPLDNVEQYDGHQEITYDFSHSIDAPSSSHQSLPPMGTVLPAYQEPQQPLYSEPMDESYHQHHGHGSSVTMSHFQEPSQPLTRSFNSTPTLHAEESQYRSAFATPREVLFMQVFVEEVALWMDSMDAEKHFSELLPFQALHQPMLRYSFLACGARHMNLINPSQYPDDIALEYYAKANRLFLRLLQNPDRDTALCATTASILNVYEVMTEKALQRMNHIAGSRALIKECKWNARSFGIGRACFFLNVGLELFSCLHFNWQVAWDPDEWGMDMTMDPQSHGGNEEAWVHKILHILAKVANFRASMPRFQEQTVAAEQLRFNKRLQTWMDLKSWCDRWQACIPPTMNPMAYVPPYLAAATKSSFPEVWLIKRPTIVARMFYHSAMALLGATHPDPGPDPEYKQSLEEMKTSHSRQICGIVAHVKDRGVGSVSLRCLAIAAECLTDRREQEEVLNIFARIKREGGWRIQFVIDELHEKWGWNDQHRDPSTNHHTTASTAAAVAAAAATTTAITTTSNPPSFYHQGPGQASMSPLPQQQPQHQPQHPQPSAPRKPPSGIINPLYRNADFSNPDPPYKNFYVPPTLPPPLPPLPQSQHHLRPHSHTHSHTQQGTVAAGGAGAGAPHGLVTHHSSSSTTTGGNTNDFGFSAFAAL